METSNTQSNNQDETPFFDLDITQTTQTGDISDDAWIDREEAKLRVWGIIAKESRTYEHREQERTTLAKGRFLEVYGKTIGTITLACDQANIERKTYYNWMSSDPEFRSKVNKTNDDRIDMVEDRLLKLIQQDDGPSIRFFLQAQDAKYKNKSSVEVVQGDRTFEDILYEQAEAALALENKEKKHDNTIQ